MAEVDAEAISNDPSRNIDPSYQPYMDQRPPSSAANMSIPTPPMDPEADEDPIQPPKDFNEHFPAHLPVPPFIHVQGVPNFRDLGGYPCPPPTNADPSKQYMVRKNLLFRCAHPTQLTQHGAATLRNLGITNIYDLRSLPEIDKLAHSPPPSPTSAEPPMSPGKSVPPQPKPLNTSAGYIVIPGVARDFTPVYAREDYSPVALARKLKWYTAANDPSKTYSEGFVNAYRDIATYGASGGAYATILRQTLRSAENMQRHPEMGQRRRPTSAFADLDWLIEHQKEMDASPGHSRTVSTGNDVVSSSTGDAATVTSTLSTADATTLTPSPSREKKDGGLIFHCTAGKDRTGVLAAVILTLLGVDIDTICWEYAITEPGLGSWRNLFIDRISRSGMGGPNSESQYANEGKAKRGSAVGSGPTPSTQMTRAEAARICGSRASNMRAFLEQVLTPEFGGAEGYLVEYVGLSGEEVRKLKSGLVVEVSERGEVVECKGIKGWSLERGMEDDYVDEEGVNGEERGR